ncbi:MAG: helix-turn-helix domain-containing protein [Pigmentiphaga sp.]|nr:helix-turn-helix domain-containing protein [Pigmentiphaga sp.]
MDERQLPAGGKRDRYPASNPRDFVGGLAKGLEVIQTFSDATPRLTLVEVAQRTGLTRASARRVLLTLCTLGFAEKVDDRHFMLTPKVLQLGNAYLSSTPMWQFAEPVLEQLVRELDETCSLSVLDGEDAVYVLRIPVRRVLNRVSTVGSRLPAYCTSMGRMLLAMQTDDQLEHYLETVALRPYNASTIVDKAVLRDVLMKTRQDGFAWVAGEIVPSIKGLAVPVFHTSGRALAALTVSINRAELDDEAFVRRALPALKRASTRLSASMAALADPASSARMSMFSF